MSLANPAVWLGVGLWGLLVAGGGTVWYWWTYRFRADRPDDYVDTIANGCMLSGLSAALAAAGALILAISR